MDADKLISYVGYSPEDKEFDEYLKNYGFKTRLRKIEGTVWVKNKDKTISLELQLYESYLEESLAPSKNKGLFVLCAIEFKEKFTGNLPLSLHFSMTITELESLLGKPKKIIDKIASTYYAKGYLIVVHYNAEKIDWISFRLPDIYDKKHGLVD